MGYEVTIFFYLMIGIGVAMALWVGNQSHVGKREWFPTVTAPFFWPIYVPLLLANRSSQAITNESPAKRPGLDSMGQQIQQVESELSIALQSLDGWAEHALAGERDRIGELRLAWHQQAQRIREIDELLKMTSVDNVLNSPSEGVEPSEAATPIEGKNSDQKHPSRIEESDRIRRENLLKLKSVRDQLQHDLMNTLAWVRELATMIHLAKYTGAPASRAEELVKQIAAAVEGLSEGHHSK
jgi:hypothetical protein